VTISETTGTRAIVWLRSDLRTHDNPALWHARRRAGRGVVAVFTLCPVQWRQHDWGPIKVGFILRTLAELERSLQPLRIPLRLVTAPTFQDVPAALLRLASALRCDELHFGREYEWNERRRDQAVTEAFNAAGLTVVPHTTKVLAEPGSVRTKDGKDYGVFTPFKKRLYAGWAQSGMPEPLPTPKACDSLVCASDPVPLTLPGFEPTDDTQVRADLWPAGEHEALRRLDRFVGDGLAAYKDRRDAPGLNGTSTLSPYLTIGALSPARCLHAAAAANDGACDTGGPGPVHWISEVVWREFYQHILVGFSHVSRGRSFNRAYDDMAWETSDEHFNAWCRGLTGVPIVDAAMRQLNQTGWMHNRCRMIVAMYLTKTLLLDWRLGERYFMQRLIDGDLGSNNGGWQWSSSTGTDAAPYFRIYNPITQSETHDPDGRYIRRFVPELADVPHEAVHDPHSRLGQGLFGRLDYPTPLVDLHSTRERAIERFKTFRHDQESKSL
jgi:deoxyribodipyrimidine photo-lyase